MMSIKSAFKRMMGTQAEDGQAIVLIALFMVVMLAMVGVAIDGGGLFLLWRDAQNAADTAALQAAYDRCTTDDETTWQGVGYRAADINGFDDTNGDATDPDEEDFSPDVQVTVKETFITGTGYVHVIIEAVKPSYFIQLVYRGPLQVKAEAMVYCSRAVDFSDLPGAIALGDCNCPYNPDDPDRFTKGGESRFDLSGSAFWFDGGAHSNCDLEVNGSNGGAPNDFLGAPPTATNNIYDHGKATYPTGHDATTGSGQPPVLADPLGLDMAMYAPGGEIFDNVELAEDYYSDWSPSGTVEGLVYVEGDVDLGSAVIGDKGLTVVATGQIFGIRPKNTTWYYYGYNGETNGDFGVAERFDSGYWPSILAFTLMDNRDDCNNPGPSSSAIVIVHTADEKDGELDVVGVAYAPMGWINWNGNEVNGKGAMIGWSIEWGGSSATFIFDPSMLPPRAPYMNNAQ